MLDRRTADSNLSSHAFEISPRLWNRSYLRFQHWFSASRNGEKATGCDCISTQALQCRDSNHRSIEYTPPAFTACVATSNRQQHIAEKLPDETDMGEVRYDNQCGSLAIGQDKREGERTAHLLCATPYSIGYRSNQTGVNGSPCFDLTKAKGLDLPSSHLLGLEDHLMAGRSLIRKQVSSALFFFNQFDTHESTRVGFHSCGDSRVRFSSLNQYGGHSHLSKNGGFFVSVFWPPQLVAGCGKPSGLLGSILTSLLTCIQPPFLFSSKEGEQHQYGGSL